MRPKARRDRLTETHATGAPDLVAEVLTPSTARLDVIDKRRHYARAGVQELWIVDPESDVIHVYRTPLDSARPAAVLSRPDTLTTPLLPGFSAALETLFPA